MSTARASRTSISLVLVAVLGLLLSATPASAATLTFSRTDFGVGTAPRFVAMGDLNGDGKPDLVSANVGSNTVPVLLNTGLLDQAALTVTGPTDIT